MAFAWTASTREPSARLLFDSESLHMQTHRVHTSASENPHMFFLLELIKKGSSSVSPKLTFAFSSFIKNLTCEKEDQPNFISLKKSGFCLVDLLTSRPFIRRLTGVTRRARAYNFILFFFFLLCEIQFRSNILVLMSNFLHHDHVH